MSAVTIAQTLLNYLNAKTVIPKEEIDNYLISKPDLDQLPEIKEILEKSHWGKENFLWCPETLESWKASLLQIVNTCCKSSVTSSFDEGQKISHDKKVTSSRSNPLALVNQNVGDIEIHSPFHAVNDNRKVDISDNVHGGFNPFHSTLQGMRRMQLLTKSGLQRPPQQYQEDNRMPQDNLKEKEPNISVSKKRKVSAVVYADEDVGISTQRQQSQHDESAIFSNNNSILNICNDCSLGSVNNNSNFVSSSKRMKRSDIDDSITDLIHGRSSSLSSTGGQATGLRLYSWKIVELLK